MASFAGKLGTVRIGANDILEIKTWSIEETANTTPTTTLGDAWESSVLTTKAWSGQLDCFWADDDSTGQDLIKSGMTATVDFYPQGIVTSDIYYSGSVIVTSLSRSAANDGMVEASFSFTGDGALTENTVPV